MILTCSIYFITLKIRTNTYFVFLLHVKPSDSVAFREKKKASEKSTIKVTQPMIKHFRINAKSNGKIRENAFFFSYISFEIFGFCSEAQNLFVLCVCVYAFKIEQQVQNKVCTTMSRARKRMRHLTHNKHCDHE